jgi:hypothetical protein
VKVILDDIENTTIDLNTINSVRHERPKELIFSFCKGWEVTYKYENVVRCLDNLEFFIAYNG